MTIAVEIADDTEGREINSGRVQDLSGREGTVWFPQENGDSFLYANRIGMFSAKDALRNGQELAVRKDSMGFMAVDPTPGEQDITLAFITPLENRLGRVMTGVTLVGIVGLIFVGLRAERRG